MEVAMAPVSSPALPASWATILENVQQAITQAQAEAVQTAQTLDAALATDAGGLPDDTAWRRSMEQLEEKFRQMKDCTARADQQAQEAEQALAQSEEALRQWLALAEAIRRKLATPGRFSV
jgi:hypothetical protein